MEALPIAEALVDQLREMKQVKQAEVAGSLRRRRETIGDVDLICSLADHDPAAGEAVAAAFVKFPEVERVLGQGSTKASVVTAGGLQVDLRIVPAEHFGAALMYFTGSKEHNVRLRGRALDMGLTLNEWGLYKLTSTSRSACRPAARPRGRPCPARPQEDRRSARRQGRREQDRRGRLQGPGPARTSSRSCARTAARSKRP